MKKHIVIHQITKQSKARKQIKFNVKPALIKPKNNGRYSRSSEGKNNSLMQRYLYNQKTMGVKVAFGELFDSQSRYKVAAKKREFPMNNTQEDGYLSNISFNDQNNQNRSVSNSQQNISHRSASEDPDPNPNCQTSITSSERQSIQNSPENLENELRMIGQTG
jgi:hypothetical protein